MKYLATCVVMALLGCTCALPRYMDNFTPEQINAELRSLFGYANEDAVVGAKGIDDSLAIILDEFRTSLQNGFPAYGIPPLDPLFLEHGNIRIDSTTADLRGSFDNVTINKISAYFINNVHMDVLRMKVTFDLFFDSIDTFGDRYDIDGVLAVLPIYGTGPFQFSLLNVSLTGEVKMGLVNGSVQVLDMPVDLNFPAVFSNLEGLMGGGSMAEMVNQMIMDFAPTIFNEIKAPIISAFVGRVVAFANSMLQGLTFDELLDIILGIGGAK
ncbi:Hypothetical predicted protein [Cloeon dipterum]|uniref:Hemolymph juvenile hormone binding protein n=1 Tax=Cloeon dipterum TaxID=197152 RepID=A0A8S1CFI9_9INSE|nr:Hypothetical predicted protein [Cloeon dipterum]